MDAELQRVTDEAIERGFNNASIKWRVMALENLYRFAKCTKTFTVNDFRDMVALSPIKTHDNRAMGGVIQTARKEGWIKPTGKSIPSRVGHKVHIQVWESLIFKSNG